MAGDDDDPPEWPAALPLPPAMLRDFVERVRACEAAYRMGEPLAAAEALTLCAIYRQPIPMWLEPAAIGAFVASRKKADIRRALDRRRHYARWATVKALRKVPKGQRLTWDETYEESARQLCGTTAAGSADVMKRSYDRVQRDLRNGQFGWFFDPQDKRYRGLDFNYAATRTAGRKKGTKRR